MAKKKTTESGTVKSKSAAHAKSTGPAGVPSIDTSAAAQAAASLVRNRALLSAAPQAGKRESQAFKQLKQGLSKPQGPGGILQDAVKLKKTNRPQAGGNLVVHNQTFGADASRASVPRRTSTG
jgi:hypothetical protein